MVKAIDWDTSDYAWLLLLLSFVQALDVSRLLIVPRLLSSEQLDVTDSFLLAGLSTFTFLLVQHCYE
jgi:hypothetical protein